MTVMTFFTIQRHEHVQYMSIEDCFRANARRHRANGDRYLAEGKPDYASGSYRKAEKNDKRANDIARYLI